MSLRKYFLLLLLLRGSHAKSHSEDILENQIIKAALHRLVSLRQLRYVLLSQYFALQSWKTRNLQRKRSESRADSPLTSRFGFRSSLSWNCTWSTFYSSKWTLLSSTRNFTISTLAQRDAQVPARSCCRTFVSALDVEDIWRWVRQNPKTYVLSNNLHQWVDFVVCALRASKSLQPLFPTRANFVQNKSISFDTQGKVEIKPDLSYWSGGRCIFLADAKYKVLSDRKHKKGKAVNEVVLTPDLYQLLSYVIATKLRYGMLIYAESLPAQQNSAPSVPIRYPDLTPANTNVHLLRRGLNLAVEPAHLIAQIEDLGAEIHHICVRQAWSQYLVNTWPKSDSNHLRNEKICIL